jgi:hypothetical protein
MNMPKLFMFYYVKTRPGNITSVPIISGNSAVTIIPVLRIRDVYPGSRILIFTDPGSKNSNKREG